MGHAPPLVQVVSLCQPLHPIPIPPLPACRPAGRPPTDPRTAPPPNPPSYPPNPNRSSKEGRRTQKPQNTVSLLTATIKADAEEPALRYCFRRAAGRVKGASAACEHVRGVSGMCATVSRAQQSRVWACRAARAHPLCLLAHACASPPRPPPHTHIPLPSCPCHNNRAHQKGSTRSSPIAQQCPPPLPSTLVSTPQGCLPREGVHAPG